MNILKPFYLRGLEQLRWLYAHLPRITKEINARRVERRRVRRSLYMHQGALTFPSRPAFPAIDCLIRDLSHVGAQVELTSRCEDDGVFLGGVRLYIAPNDHERDCEIVWRKGIFFGLRFQGDPLPISRDFRHPYQRGR